jgi:hypothetical protein
MDFSNLFKSNVTFSMAETRELFSINNLLTDFCLMKNEFPSTKKTAEPFNFLELFRIEVNENKKITKPIMSPNRRFVQVK